MMNDPENLFARLKTMIAAHSAAIEKAIRDNPMRPISICRTPSTLSQPRYKIQHVWNKWPYFVELLECTGSDDQKWFVKTPAEQILICDPDRSDFKSVWLYHPHVKLGFDTAQQALAAFDETMAAIYAGVIDHR